MIVFRSAASLALAGLSWFPPCSEAADRRTLFEQFYGTIGVSMLSHNYAMGNTDRKSSGHSLRVSIGRYISPKFHVALEGVGQTSKYSYALDQPTAQSQSYRHSAYSVSLNAHRTFFTKGRFSSSAGAGIGIHKSRQTSVTEYADIERKFSTRFKSKRFQYNVSANLSYRLSGRISAQVGGQINSTSGGNSNQIKNVVHLSIHVSVAPKPVRR